jgi:predicted DNA-binding transcriptional regulator YafY
VERYGADRFTWSGRAAALYRRIPDADSVLSWVLTFGDKAELLEPQELRERLGELTKNVADRYGRD